VLLRRERGLAGAPAVGSLTGLPEKTPPFQVRSASLTNPSARRVRI